MTDQALNAILRDELPSPGEAVANFAVEHVFGRSPASQCDCHRERELDVPKI